MNKPVSNSFDVTKRVGLQIRKFRNEKKMSQLDLAIASEIELYLLFKFIDWLNKNIITFLLESNDIKILSF